MNPRSLTHFNALSTAIRPIDRLLPPGARYQAAKEAVKAFAAVLEQEMDWPVVLYPSANKGAVSAGPGVSDHVPWWTHPVGREAQEKAGLHKVFAAWEEVFTNDPRPAVRDAASNLCLLSKADAAESLLDMKWAMALRNAINELKSALDTPQQVTSPFLIRSITTPQRMKKDVVSSESWSGLMELLDAERTDPGKICHGLVHGYDLQRLTIDELEALVKLAARVGVTLTGCGVSQETAIALAQRLEAHCVSCPDDKPALLECVNQLRVAERPREIRLAVKGGVKPSQMDGLDVLSVGFKECRTTGPIPQGQGLVVSTGCLKTCTAIAVLTQLGDGSRVVTLSHMPNADMLGDVNAAVGAHHSPDAASLDHELFVITPGLHLPGFNNEWGIYREDIRTGLQMSTFTAPLIGEPASTDAVGPDWFHHLKTTLLPYPQEQNHTTGAAFTLLVPEDASRPVEFFLDLS